MSDPSQSPENQERSNALLDAKRERDRVYNAAYYAANRDKEIARFRAYRAANRDKEIARNRAYRAANRDKEIARNRAYFAANRDKVRAASRSREKSKYYSRVAQGLCGECSSPIDADQIALRRTVCESCWKDRKVFILAQWARALGKQ